MVHTSPDAKISMVSGKKVTECVLVCICFIWSTVYVYLCRKSLIIYVENFRFDRILNKNSIFPILTRKWITQKKTMMEKKVKFIRSVKLYRIQCRISRQNAYKPVNPTQTNQITIYNVPFLLLYHCCCWRFCYFVEIFFV